MTSNNPTESEMQKVSPTATINNGNTLQGNPILNDG